MGLIALFGLAVYAWLVIAIAGSTIVSSVRCRAIPLFWVIAAISLVVVPLVIHESLPMKSGTDYGALSYFLSGAFSWVNLVCFCGAMMSAPIQI